MGSSRLVKIATLNVLAASIALSPASGLPEDIPSISGQNECYVSMDGKTETIHFGVVGNGSNDEIIVRIASKGIWLHTVDPLNFTIDEEIKAAGINTYKKPNGSSGINEPFVDDTFAYAVHLKPIHGIYAGMYEIKLSIYSFDKPASEANGICLPSKDVDAKP